MRNPESRESNPEHIEKGDVEVPLKPEVFADKEVELEEAPANPSVEEIREKLSKVPETVRNESYITFIQSQLSSPIPQNKEELRMYVSFLQQVYEHPDIQSQDDIKTEVRQRLNQSEAKLYYLENLEKVVGSEKSYLVPPEREKKEKKNSVWSKLKGKVSRFFSSKEEVPEEQDGFAQLERHMVGIEEDETDEAEEELQAQTNAVELIAPPDATPEVKRDMFALLKKEWARTAKTEIMGIALPTILVGGGANMGMRYAVKKGLQASFGMGTGIALGAATGGVIGFGKSYYTERERTNTEREVAIEKTIGEKITDELDLERLKSLKGKARLDALAEMLSEGNVKKLKKEIETEAGIKVNWKKVARSSLYGAVLGAAGAAVAGLIFDYFAGAIDVPHITGHASVPAFSHPEITSTPDLSHISQHINHVSSMPIHEVPAFHPHVDPTHIKVGGMPDIATHEPSLSAPVAEHLDIDTHIAPLHEIGSLELSNQLGIPEGMYNSIDADHTSVQEMLGKIGDAGASEDIVKPALALDSLKPTGDELGMTVKEFLKHRIMVGGGVVFKDL